MAPCELVTVDLSKLGIDELSNLVIDDSSNMGIRVTPPFQTWSMLARSSGNTEAV